MKSLITLFLIPCLLVDPVWVTASMQFPSDVVTSRFQHNTRFESEALVIAVKNTIAYLGESRDRAKVLAMHPTETDGDNELTAPRPSVSENVTPALAAAAAVGEPAPTTNRPRPPLASEQPAAAEPPSRVYVGNAPISSHLAFFALLGNLSNLFLATGASVEHRPSGFHATTRQGHEYFVAVKGSLNSEERNPEIAISYRDGKKESSLTLKMDVVYAGVFGNHAPKIISYGAADLFGPRHNRRIVFGMDFNGDLVWFTDPRFIQECKTGLQQGGVSLTLPELPVSLQPYEEAHSWRGALAVSHLNPTHRTVLIEQFAFNGLVQGLAALTGRPLHEVTDRLTYQNIPSYPNGLGLRQALSVAMVLFHLGMPSGLQRVYIDGQLAELHIASDQTEVELVLKRYPYGQWRASTIPYDRATSTCYRDGTLAIDFETALQEIPKSDVVVTGANPFVSGQHENAVVKATQKHYDKLAPVHGDFWDSYLDVDQRQHGEAFLEWVRPEGIILDNGAGVGKQTTWFREKGRTVIAADLSPEQLRAAKEHHPALEAVQMDLRHMAFPNDSLAGIWDNGAFHHVPMGSVPETLLGYYDALEPGGILFVRAKRFDRVPGEQRRFTFYEQSELASAVRHSGFEILEQGTEPALPTRRIQTGDVEWVYVLARKPGKYLWSPIWRTLSRPPPRLTELAIMIIALSWIAPAITHFIPTGKISSAALRTSA